MTAHNQDFFKTNPLSQPHHWFPYLNFCQIEIKSRNLRLFQQFNNFKVSYNKIRKLIEKKLYVLKSPNFLPNFNLQTRSDN